MYVTDYALDLLLDYDGLVIQINLGYWVKIEAKMILESSINKPFGIKYSLTLHTPTGERILGYDNAHGFSSRNKYGTDDHIHKSDRVIAYEYESAEQLLIDFWADVDLILKRSLH